MSETSRHKRSSQGFNRTFMELKYNRSRQLTQDTASFNRTFMELKFSLRTLTRVRIGF